MRIPRIYHPEPLAPDTEIDLTDNAAGHVTKVLRLKPGAPLVLFDGTGGEYRAELLSVERRGTVRAHVGGFDPVDRESPLHLTLAQGISRGERMDYTIQKAVELGVTRIVPIIAERTVVKLSSERWEKRHRHWQGVVVSACEQCGRNTLPEVTEPTLLRQYLEQRPQNGFLLDPFADASDIFEQPAAAATLLIGPEGGLSGNERDAAYGACFIGLRLGPRILRTETAALAAVSVLQARWGDA